MNFKLQFDVRLKKLSKRATCTSPGFAPDCTQSAKITCLSGSGWNFPTTVCVCKMPEKTCPELNVLKAAAARKGAEIDCDNANTDKVQTTLNSYDDLVFKSL